jgi:hypothetical protein
VVLDSSASGPVIREDQESCCARRIPAAVLCDIVRDPHLAIDPVEHRLHIRDDRLDLDDKERSGRRMEGEDIDRAALSPDVERDLCRRDPICRSQEFEHPFDEVGVTRVEQPIESFALPQESNIDARSKRRCDTHEDVDGDPVGLPALDPPDSRTRDPGPSREVELSPVAPAAKRSDPKPEPDDVHRQSMATMGSPTLTTGFRRRAARFVTNAHHTGARQPVKIESPCRTER